MYNFDETQLLNSATTGYVNQPTTTFTQYTPRATRSNATSYAPEIAGGLLLLIIGGWIFLFILFVGVMLSIIKMSYIMEAFLKEYRYNNQLDTPTPMTTKDTTEEPATLDLKPESDSASSQSDSSENTTTPKRSSPIQLVILGILIIIFIAILVAILN